MVEESQTEVKSISTPQVRSQWKRIPAEENIYILSPEEERMIDEAEREPCISAEEAEKDMDTWFRNQRNLS